MSDLRPITARVNTKAIQILMDPLTDLNSERETETETETDRQTERDRQKETDRQRRAEKERKRSGH